MKAVRAGLEEINALRAQLRQLSFPSQATRYAAVAQQLGIKIAALAATSASLAGQLGRDDAVRLGLDVQRCMEGLQASISAAHKVAAKASTLPRLRRDPRTRTRVKRLTPR
jgi:hypothetical protein